MAIEIMQTGVSSANQPPTQVGGAEGAKVQLVMSDITFSQTESDTAKQGGQIAMGLEGAVAKLREFAQSMQRNLDFFVDDASGRTVIRVMDRNTNEVVRQIPSETMLALARNLEKIKGALFDDKA